MVHDFLKSYSYELYEVLKAMDEKAINEIFSEIENAFKKKKNIYVLGNGGSAASASHWVCDFGKGVNNPGSDRMKIHALSDNGAILTAIGNDITYDDIFSYQLESLCNEGDLLIGLSVSGNSKNILNAYEIGKNKKCRIVSIIGDFNGKMAELSNVTLIIKSRNYGIVEDVHMVINHGLSQYLKSRNK